MNLQELIKRAAPLPYHAATNTRGRIVTEGYEDYVEQEHYLAGRHMVAHMNDDRAGLSAGRFEARKGMPPEEATASMILLIHAVNMLPKLVEALEYARLISMTREHAEFFDGVLFAANNPVLP